MTSAAREHTGQVQEIAQSLSYVHDMDYNKGNTGKWVLTNYIDFIEEAQRLIEANPQKFREIDVIINSLKDLGLNSVDEKDIAERVQVELLKSD
jgi:two-component sensor histidine kinase